MARRRRDRAQVAEVRRLKLVVLGIVVLWCIPGAIVCALAGTSVLLLPFLVAATVHATVVAGRIAGALRVQQIRFASGLVDRPQLPRRTWVEEILRSGRYH